ncbi:MAG: OmpA family protein [Bdellovibrionia bacterium]
MKKVIILNRNPLFVFIPLVIGVAACSNGPLVQEIANTASPTEEIKSLDTDLHTAYAKQVNVLSPTNYKEAENYLEAAKRSLKDKKDSKDTLHEVAVGRHYLERSYGVAKLSDTYMEEVVSARQRAIGVGAAIIAAGEFRDADRHLRSVTTELERNELKSTAKNRAKLQEEYLALELKAIKQNYLGQARDTVHQALTEGAKGYAPQSLAIAEKTITDVDAFIIANRHDTEKLTLRSNEALANANHVLKITRAAKMSEKVSPEELALKLEKGQDQVIDGQNQLQIKQTELSTEVEKISALKSQNRNLEAEQAINRVFEGAQGVFTKNEAEVYKQDGVLKIRLRGLEFPTSQAALRGSSFPLLAKVQKVIQGFGKSTIVVEGYTDSLGDKKSNIKLSLDRALAVREYLISNVNIKAADIKAVGYGYQKPLASDKTIAGRAQNRRVDILIKPEETQNL